jgi:hypothetical protein
MGIAATVLGLSLALGACGSSSSATPTATVPTGTANPGSSSAGLDGSGIPGLGGLHGAPDLEAKLPAQVCGTNAFKLSFAGSSLPASASGLAGALGGLLGGLPATTQLNWAIAGPDPTSGSDCGTTIFAIQVSGTGADSVFTLMQQAATSDGGSISQASVGGKNVTVLTDSSGSKTYGYVSGDTIYGVSADDDTAAGQAISQLP